MTSRILYAILPLMGGAMLAAQAPINARLRSALGSPFGSAVVSFTTGLAFLLIALVVSGQFGRLTGVGTGPWWAYLGGALGAFFVVVGLLAVPRVGVTVTFVAVIAGQMLSGMLIDRFGWLNVPAQALTWERVTAVGLVGVALVLLVRP